MRVILAHILKSNAAFDLEVGNPNSEFLTLEKTWTPSCLFFFTVMSDVYLHFQLRELYRQYYRCDKLICLLIKANT